MADNQKLPPSVDLSNADDDSKIMATGATAAADSPQLRSHENANEESESHEQESVHLETRANYSSDDRDADHEKYADEGDDDDDNAGAPSGGAADLITQVSKDEPRKEDEEETPPAGWTRRLCSCLFSTKKQRRQADLNPTPKPPINQPQRPSGSSDGSIEVGNGLLGPPLPQHVNKKCLVLDLDETLVHSSFKPVRNPDFIVPVTIENTVHRVYVLKRPGVDEFLKKCGEVYEVVVFTASLSKYADPLLDILDPEQFVCARLFREACVLHCGTYVKDLSKLGRKLADTIIIDNSQQSYAFQPNNAIPIDSWFDDKSDTQLYDLLPFLLDTLVNTDDVRTQLDASQPFSWLLRSQ